MKKIFSLAISLVLILFSVFGVCATVTDPDDVYYIEELGFSIHTPMYYGATKSVNHLEISQEQYEEFLDALEKQGVYYYGLSKLIYYDYYTEIYIYGEESDTRSLSSISDILLNTTIENQNEGWKEAGVTVVKNEIYESYDAKYIMTHFTDKEGNYAINYYTVENYKSIDIVMWCYGGEPSTDNKQELVTIINSIKFDEPTGKQIYEETFTFSIAKDGKFTPFGESLIITSVAVLIQIIAGIVILIVFVNKAKKRRKAAISAETVQSDSKFCIYCDAELKAVDTFCHKCGNKQAASNTNENTDI